MEITGRKVVELKMTGRKWVDQTRAARARSAPPSRGSRSSARSAAVQRASDPGNGVETDE